MGPPHDRPGDGLAGTHRGMTMSTVSLPPHGITRHPRLRASLREWHLARHAMAQPVAALVTAEHRWQQTTHGRLEPTCQQPCAVDTLPLYRDRLVIHHSHTFSRRLSTTAHALPNTLRTVTMRGTSCGGLRCMAVGDRVLRLGTRRTAPWRVRVANPWAWLLEGMSPCIHRP